jgi:hypothetical protein
LRIEVAEGTGTLNVEIKYRKWKILRMGGESIAKRSVEWVPPGKRRPKHGGEL